MRSLPRRAPSLHLKTSLKVLASRERARRLSRVSFAAKFASWRERAALSLNNLMKPLMWPVAGGFASACLLFGMLVPDFTVEVHPIHNDVPTPVLFTQASVNYSMPLAISDSEIVLDVHVDDNGRMTDYNVVSGQSLLLDGDVRRRLESTLLVTQFNPATTFGQPTYGKLRVRLVRNEIDVKG
jgi:hypothetical protein